MNTPSGSVVTIPPVCFKETRMNKKKRRVAKKHRKNRARLKVKANANRKKPAPKAAK